MLLLFLFALFFGTREKVDKLTGWNRLVQTEMGNKGAQMMGLEEAPNTLEESTSKTVALVSVNFPSHCALSEKEERRILLTEG